MLKTTCGHPATPTYYSEGTFATVQNAAGGYDRVPVGGKPMTPGYAVTEDGRVLCYACADGEQAAALATQDVTYAYLSESGKNVTTWTGGVLMRVTSHTTARAGFSDSTIHYCRAVESNGTRWYGKNGGPGMAIAMRRAKVSA